MYLHLFISHKRLVQSRTAFLLLCCGYASSWTCTATVTRGRRERERDIYIYREREFTPFQPNRADAGALRTSPGRYHNRVFNHCVEQQKSLPKIILTEAVGNEEQLQNMHIPKLSKKPRTMHLPWRQTKEASVIKPSNICELCCATTQCKSTNQTMPGDYYNNTSEQTQRFSKCRQRVPQAH